MKLQKQVFSVFAVIALLSASAVFAGEDGSDAEEYEKAAARLKDAPVPVPLGKVDATVNVDVAKRFDVSGYPTLKWKKGGEWSDYEGPRDADGCGHCKKLAPEYEKAAQSLQYHDPPIPLGKVDATIETELAKQFEVSGYPTLKMFRRGKPQEYKGGRDQFTIMDYMRKQSGEAAKLLPTVSDVKGFMDKALVKVIGFYDNLQDEKLRLYMDVANGMRDDVSFGYTLLPEARDMYRVNPGSVVVFTPEKFWTKFEPKYHILKTEKLTPLVGQYSAQSDKFYAEYTKNILCLAFYTVDWSFDYREAVAKDYKDIKFAIASEEEYINSLMVDFGLADSGEEFNVGCFKEMEPMEEYDDDEIREFLDKLKKGKLEPQIKSQPIPKKSSSNVKVIVGKTFDKIVGDKSKDVLIEMYAPWCGHCKSLEPIYKDLAKSVKKEKNLVIAKIDATANDIPDAYKVEGFPTIYFAPANSKDAPLKFEGDRTVEGFKKYLEEHATVSFGKSLRDEL
ncbi:PDIA4-like protein [Mya arenaria]|uniref:Protein disulfide-isomerase n=1 Tax=Mya arenaria TaxID=6604 RepID=A0ABY7DBY6_MYAAR|nr:PDIA4-like protein [Mya arenaria]